MRSYSAGLVTLLATSILFACAASTAPPSSDSQDLTSSKTRHAHDGGGNDAPCDPKEGIRKNSACDAGLRCDEVTKVCTEPTEKGAFCFTHRSDDDTCADGLVCKFDRATSQGDEGFDGRCAER
jgi:hypothetical protein